MDIPFVFGKIADGEDFTDRVVARIGRRTIVWGIVCLVASATCCSTSSAIMRCLFISLATSCSCTAVPLKSLSII